MKHRLAALLLCAGPAAAATLQADSLVCETDAPIVYALQGSPVGGAEKLRRSKATLEAMQADDRATGTAAAARRADPGLQRLVEDNRKGVSASLAELVAKCAASEAAVAVTVLERRPITGVAKVSMPFRGAPATVFTPLSAVTD